MTRKKEYKIDPQVSKKLEELEREINNYETELEDVKKKMDRMEKDMDTEIEEYIKVDLENEFMKYVQESKSKGIIKKYGPLLVGIPSIICGVMELEEDPNTGIFELGVGFVTSGWGMYQKTRGLGDKLVRKVGNYFNRPPCSPKKGFRGKAKRYLPHIFS